MTKAEIKRFIDALAQLAVKSSPIRTQSALGRKYVEINKDFMATMGADQRIEDFTQQQVEGAWGAFCAGFVCGQDKPHAGR